MAIEIVSFPSYKMVIFHNYVNVYQRVGTCNYLTFWDPGLQRLSIFGDSGFQGFNQLQ